MFFENKNQLLSTYFCTAKRSSSVRQTSKYIPIGLFRSKIKDESNQCVLEMPYSHEHKSALKIALR